MRGLFSMYIALETMKTFVMCCIRIIAILYSFPLIRSLFSDNVLRLLFFLFCRRTPNSQRDNPLCSLSGFNKNYIKLPNFKCMISYKTII